MAPPNTPDAGDRPEGRFSFVVNQQTHHNADAQIEAEEALTQSGHDPADQHVLIEIKDRGTDSVGLEQKISLKNRVPVFRAFLSDRIYRFAVEGRGYEWGLATINEAELRAIHGIAPDKVFSLDREDGDALIDDGADIDLEAPGAERLNVVKRRDVEIKVNTKPVQITRGWHTGAQIKAAAIAQGVAIQPDFVLDLEGEGGATRIIGDDDRVFIRGGERFGAVDNHEDS